MKTLYFIRHAESEANKSRILASQMAFSLTPAGKADSLEIASQLKELTDIDTIVSSPLRRAVQTAESFKAVYDLDIQIDDRLTEQYLGTYSGMSYEEVKDHEEYETDSLKRWNWIPEGDGESYSMIAERICDFLRDLIKLDNYTGRILIVTHAVALRLIIAALKDTLPDYPAAFPNNGEILKVNFCGLGNKHEIESIFLGNSKSFNHNP